MRTFKYFLGVVLFVGVFLLGKLMIMLSQKWSVAPSSSLASRPELGKFFLYGGRIIQVVAVIGGFLDAVSVLVLGLAF